LVRTHAEVLGEGDEELNLEAHAQQFADGMAEAVDLC
jgi:hypothetical protein